MKNKKILLGILSMMFVFGFTGCDDELLSSNYSFEFRVQHQNTTLYNGRQITKIEFINGSSENASVLQTEITNLSYNEMSSTYKVSGFSEKNGDDKRIYGVKLSLDDGKTFFGWSSATDKSKILVALNVIHKVSFENGSW